MCVDLPLDKKTVENQDWATGPLGHRAAGPSRAVGRGPMGLRAAGPLGRRGPWAAGRWAAGLLLAKPQFSHQNVWSFRLYMIWLWDFVPDWNSRLVTTTRVNSHRSDLRRHDILWWYHVNKCRAMRGHGSELTAVRKSPWCHVNTPSIILCKHHLILVSKSHKFNLDMFYPFGVVYPKTSGNQCKKSWC